ncbi:unnamed protein product [Cuscuta europaea]|uniref:Reverse transcriptase zinc-binding domain-containing protein n=1 Tax=Cuscuta europaea TaxID=41803 RepID=A0A9P1EAX4_CUSEU|nr:unnamed protein product [Cuscuta europaea]
MDHVLYQCSYAKKVWNHFMGVMEIPTPVGKGSIRQIFMAWWLEAGTKSMGDIYKHNLPGIIAWHIWKAYHGLWNLDIAI